jgi:hypothetical protein
MSTVGGGSCTRSASAVAFSQATSCASAQAAFSACQPGDLVGVAAGSYGSQTVTGTKGAPGCVIDMSASGSPATFASLNPVSSSAAVSYLEVRNGNIPGGWGWNSPPEAPSHLTLRNIDSTSNSLMKGGSNISIIGGSVHNWDAGSHAAAFWFEAPDTSTSMTNITVQGVTFHDLTNSVGGNHFEVIRIDTGVSNILIEGNRFYNNQENSSTIFITNTDTEPGDPHDITIENNFFGSIPDAYYHINTNTVIGTCTNWNFRYNSFASSPILDQGCAISGMSFIGNAGPRPSCRTGVTYSHNVWTGGTCGSTDKSVSSIGYTNEATGDMHLTPGSPAIGAGDPNDYPATDYDNQTRTSPPDAGADQH